VAVMAVTGDGDVLAVRAGRHAARRYQHHATSQTQLEKDLAVARTQLGPERFEHAYAEARATNPQAAIAEVLAAWPEPVLRSLTSQERELF